jgi:hypothetical protein
MYDGVIPINFKTPAQPIDRLRVSAEDQFGDAKIVHPPVRIAVAGRKPERLLGVSLAFSASTNKDFRKSDHRVGGGQIAIKRQRLLKFSNRLHCTSCEQLQRAK